MTNEEIKETPEYKITIKAAELWNDFIQLEDLSQLDLQVICENIHRIQDFMTRRLFDKEHGKL